MKISEDLTAYRAVPFWSWNDKLELIVSNRNLLGPHHAMDEEPEFVGPFTYVMSGTWKDGKSTIYRDSYSFVVPDLC